MSKRTSLVVAGLLTAGLITAVPVSAGTRAASLSAPASAGSYDPLADGPSYEYSDVGAAIADHGSHYCFKDVVSSPDLLRMMSHGCRTGWGMPGIRLGELWWAFSGLPTAARQVSWRPWGWTETAKAGGLAVVGHTYFTATDVLVSIVTLTNPGSSPVIVTPQIGLHGGPTYFGTRFPSPSTFIDAQATVEQGALKLTTTSPVTAFGSTAGPTAAAYRESRVLRTAPGIDHLSFSTAAATGTNSASRTYDGLATLTARTVPAHGSTTVSYVSGWARDETPVVQVGAGVVGDGAGTAGRLAEAAVRIIGHDPGVGFQREVSDWRAYFHRLPVPHTTTPEQTRLFYLAATALRQNWYAPINKMRTGSIVPVKAFYDAFYAWDTPYNTIGFTDSDISQAEDALITQLQVPSQTGAVPGVFGDDMQPYSHTQGPSVPVVYDDTQAPTQGLAVLRILEREHDPARRARFVAAVRGPLQRYVFWWQTYRDVNHDLLIEVGPNDDASFYAADTTGQAAFPAKTVAPMVYNANYNVLLQAVARLAREQHDLTAAASYLAEARAHTAAMNAVMWDPATNRWHTVSDQPGPLNAPTRDSADTLDAGLIALYAEGQDPAKARAYIEHTLLDPHKFFGRFPFPTTAYDDPGYAPAAGFNGKLWLNEAEPMLELLWRYGYDSQARAAYQRLVTIMSSQRKGIYEAYNSSNGDGVRFWQFSWSSAFTLEMLLERWQRRIDLRPGSASVHGYVTEATNAGQPLYALVTPTEAVPLLSLTSKGSLATSSCLQVELTPAPGDEHSRSWLVQVRGRKILVRAGSPVAVTGSRVAPGRCP